MVILGIFLFLNLLELVDFAIQSVVVEQVRMLVVEQELALVVEQELALMLEQV